MQADQDLEKGGGATKHALPTPEQSESIESAESDVTHVEKPQVEQNETAKLDESGAQPEQKQERGGSGEQAVRLGKKEFAIVYVGLILGLFLAALDQTIVSATLPVIASQFNALNQISWIGTSYLLTNTAFQPLFGRFSDIFGRKPTFLAAITIFLIGSVLCGASQNIIMLIVFRAVAGLGAGGIISGVMIIISGMVPLKDRGKYQGYLGAVWGVSAIVGPLLGGGKQLLEQSYPLRKWRLSVCTPALADKASWRWIFYINLPIGAVTLVVVVLFLHFPPVSGNFKSKLSTVDYGGSLLVVAATICILLATSWGGTTYPWRSAPIIVCYLIGGLLIIALAVFEGKVAVAPIIPFRIFKIRTPLGCYVLNLFMGMVFFGIVYYVPIYFQAALYQDPTTSGISLVPLVMAMVIFTISSGILISKLENYVWLIRAGGIFMTVGVGMLSTWTQYSNEGERIGYLIIAGVGFGLLFQTTVVAAQTAVAPKDLAISISLCTFCRLLGGAFGVSILGSIFNDSLAQNFAALVPNSQQYAEAKTSVGIIKTFPANIQPPIIECYVRGIRLIFLVSIPLAGIAFIASLLIQQHSMRTSRK
ncbi:hypothetical protein BZG36_03484 [Bifiguratus adelaidae]|uniref:Major facilitator superfamily (MFS) profile domain-containing protein n=1 Tax=Bifiguratus adelaidae TaxID=1938954 RepID=A0A261XWP0_9FUNG|nr:hypothetical protein BZG36_03484 [Bifiguratus adelaidae]